ncbi:hypothetical protein GCM10011584_34330 [Nocardioides phosphati]|uniref:Chromosome condensation regulator RCC1 n=1 Tax=Nocardioides phosphati TaxID=1867775 RepID=A0ABQ2NDR0_9ACTN|nr:hypothetical protein [Nocardioides phosphati]GGO94091.1 hypothetical protein GCM10011584_34330 [Nocardioides phosphati]
MTVVAISAGNEHCLALMEGGTVVAWGSNTHNQLAVPDGLTDVVAIAAGGYYNLALKRDGTVAAWGSEPWGLTWTPEGLAGVIAIAAGATSFALALKENGSIVAWGNNHSGESSVPMPTRPEGFRAIAAGSTNGLAVTGYGDVAAWGMYGRTPAAGLVPEQVRLGCAAIAAGGEHALGLTQRGVFAWGNARNKFGVLDVPDGLEGALAISAADFHNVALRNDGTVAVWGCNDAMGSLAVPDGLADVVAISAGTYVGLALRDDGTVVSWGSARAEVPPELSRG